MEPFQPTTYRPADFDHFWAEVEAELADLPVAAEEEALPLRDTDFCTTYGVHYTGIGPYRLFGYLSIPKGEGPFPTIINLPRYGSVLEIIPQGDSNAKRGRYLIFSPTGRGQRGADRPYAAAYPGIFTDGLDDPRGYRFRGFIADCCRAVDYVLSRPEVDPSRIAAVSGTDLPLFTAALRPQITHVVAAPSFFYAAMDRAGSAFDYPLEEINDYLRLYPQRRQGVARTLSYFEPFFFADRVRIPSLLWGDPAILGPLAELMGPQTEIRASEWSTFKDGMAQETWLAHQFGFEEPVVPPHWRS